MIQVAFPNKADQEKFKHDFAIHPCYFKEQLWEYLQAKYRYNEDEPEFAPEFGNANNKDSGIGH